MSSLVRSAFLLAFVVIVLCFSIWVEDQATKQMLIIICGTVSTSLVQFLTNRA